MSTRVATSLVNLVGPGGTIPIDPAEQFVFEVALRAKDSDSRILQELVAECAKVKLFEKFVATDHEANRSLFCFTGSFAHAAIPNPADRSKLIGGTISFGLVALVPSGLVFALFRGARK